MGAGGGTKHSFYAQYGALAKALCILHVGRCAVHCLDTVVRMTGRAQVSSGAICCNSFVLPARLGAEQRITYADMHMLRTHGDDDDTRTTTTTTEFYLSLTLSATMDHYVLRDATAQVLRHSSGRTLMIIHLLGDYMAWQ